LLPPATEQVWNYLREQPALRGFILVGGSGLALRIRHRLSEDLDFVYPQPRLPRHRLDTLQKLAAETGFEFQRNDNEAAVQDCATGGMELHDYQQDFVVNGTVQVFFFTPDPTLQRVLATPAESPVHVASLPELFKAKCLVSAVRSKSRDWLDLYLLMREHGFSIRDYQAAFVAAGSPAQCDTGLARLCSGVPQHDDEGYAHLLKNPPTLGEMTAFFRAQRDQLEVETATEAAQRRHDKNQ
jgi:hypothetical protein